MGFESAEFALPGFGNGVLAAGATSALLVLQTDAQFYQLSTANVIDGSVAYRLKQLGESLKELERR